MFKIALHFFSWGGGVMIIFSDRGDQSNNAILLSLSHFFVAFGICHGTLSCQEMNFPLPKDSFSPLYAKMCAYKNACVYLKIHFLRKKKKELVSPWANIALKIMMNLLYFEGPIQRLYSTTNHSSINVQLKAEETRLSIMDIKFYVNITMICGEIETSHGAIKIKGDLSWFRNAVSAQRKKKF